MILGGLFSFCNFYKSNQKLILGGLFSFPTRSESEILTKETHYYIRSRSLSYSQQVSFRETSTDQNKIKEGESTLARCERQLANDISARARARERERSDKEN